MLTRHYDDNNGIFNFTLALFSRTILRAFTPLCPSEKSRFASAERTLFVVEFHRGIKSCRRHRRRQSPRGPRPSS